MTPLHPKSVLPLLLARLSPGYLLH